VSRPPGSPVSAPSPSETTWYLEAVVERLRELLGDDLVGVYAGGSLALGGYDPGRSDVDVAVVCRGPLPDGRKEELAAALRHEALPCPARGLELVVYPEATVRRGTAAPGYELNLNTGRAMRFHLSLAPGGGEAGHWYAIDRAILRERGVTLLGPPPDRLFAPIARRTLLELLAASVRWHGQDGGASDDAVLNACRALRYEAEGVWSSKPDAGEWARERIDDPVLVSDALAVRAGIDRRLDRRRVLGLLGASRRLLLGAARAAPPARHS
jgi:hypothetical protein